MTPPLEPVAAQLREQIELLARQLTPGATVAVSIPADPAVVAWDDPVRYRFQASSRVEWAGAGRDPGLADRAADLLTGSGWSARVERFTEYGATQVTVAAERDGFRLMVRFQEEYEGVIYTGETPELIRTEHGRTEPFQHPVGGERTVREGAVLCYECTGLGSCPDCHGRGWISTGPADRKRCPECRGEKVCPVCRGSGELLIAMLTEFDRTHYPQLDTYSVEGDDQ